MADGERNNTRYPKLTGTVTRDVSTHAPVNLDRYMDLLLVDEKVQRFVVTAGKLSLLFQAIYFGGPYEAPPEPWTRLDFMSKGFTISLADRVSGEGGEREQGQDGILLAAFTGPVNTDINDKAVNPSQFLGVYGSMQHKADFYSGEHDPFAEFFIDAEQAYDYLHPSAEEVLSARAHDLLDGSKLWINYTRSGSIAIRNATWHDDNAGISVMSLPGDALFTGGRLLPGMLH